VSGSGSGRATPTTERGRATRQAILDAAEAVFSEESFDRASIAEIVRRAGVAQGTFYVYFPDKTSVFVELVKTLSRGLRHAIAEAVSDAPSRLEAERQGFEVFFEYIRNHTGMYRLVREAEFVEPSLYRWYYERFGAGYVRGIEKAIDAGELDTDISPETLAFCLMGIGDFVGMRWVLWENQVPPREVFEEMYRFMVRGMGMKLPQEAG
jgi:AcrR family transcriptional regulator